MYVERESHQTLVFQQRTREGSKVFVRQEIMLKNHSCENEMHDMLLQVGEVVSGPHKANAGLKARGAELVKKDEEVG
jgi:hypothetical protein